MENNILIHLFRFSENWSTSILAVLAVIWIGALCCWIWRNVISPLRKSTEATSQWEIPGEAGLSRDEALAVRN